MRIAALGFKIAEDRLPLFALAALLVGTWPEGRRHLSLLGAGNVNLALVKQALGHRSISSTMVYVGTTDGQAAEAVKAAVMGLF